MDSHADFWVATAAAAPLIGLAAAVTSAQLAVSAAESKAIGRVTGLALGYLLNAGILIALANALTLSLRELAFPSPEGSFKALPPWLHSLWWVDLSVRLS